MNSIRELREVCQRVHEDDYSAQIVRSVSIYFTWALIPFRVTANQVSVVNCIVGIAIFPLLLFGDTSAAVAIAVAMFWLNTILDGVDGEVARYWGASSLEGLYLDRANSIFVYPSLFLGLGAYAGEVGHLGVWPVVAGAVAATGLSGLRLAKTYVDATLVDALTLPKAKQEGVNDAPVDGANYQPLSEALRAGHTGLLLRLIDFVIVRQPGIAVLLTIVASSSLTLDSDRGTWLWSLYLLFYAIASIGGTVVAMRIVVKSKMITVKKAQIVKQVARTLENV